MHPVPHLGISLREILASMVPGQEQEPEMICKRILKEEHSASGIFWKLLRSLSSRKIKSNWILEWQLDYPPFSDLIESSHFFHHLLLSSYSWMAKQRYLPSFLPIIINFSNFADLFWLPFWEKKDLKYFQNYSTFKGFTLGNSIHHCF